MEKFFKIGILKNFVKLTEKYLCRSLLLIILRRATFFKTRLWNSCFLVNIVKYLETLIFQILQNNFGRLFLSLWNVFVIPKNLMLTNKPWLYKVLWRAGIMLVLIMLALNDVIFCDMVLKELALSICESLIVNICKIMPIKVGVI